MVDTWIQFGILLCAFLAFAMRNEHRITRLEEGYAGLRDRVITLERRK